MQPPRLSARGSSPPRRRRCVHTHTHSLTPCVPPPPRSRPPTPQPFARMVAVSTTTAHNAHFASIRFGGSRHKRPRLATQGQLIAAFTAVMKKELSSANVVRWSGLVQDILNGASEDDMGQEQQVEASVATTTDRKSSAMGKQFEGRVLAVCRPKITAAVLDSMLGDDTLADGRGVRLGVPGCLGAMGNVEKLLGRRVVQWLREHRGDLLLPGGELSGEKLSNVSRLKRTLSRLVSDTMVFVYKRATANAEGKLDGVVLELQSTTQTLWSKALRGSGVAFCQKGRGIFEEAVADIRASLEPLLGVEYTPDAGMPPKSTNPSDEEEDVDCASTDCDGQKEHGLSD